MSKDEKIGDITDLLRKPAENDDGHIEYKFKLTNLSADQKNHLGSQMKFRLHSDEEFGQAIYNIGLTDDGFALGLNEFDLSESLKNLQEIAKIAGAKICDVRRQKISYYAESESDLIRQFIDNTKSCDSKRKTVVIHPKEGLTEFVRHVAEVLIRRHEIDGDYIELRIGIAGSVDAGKSSLTGVLTKGALDDGRGSARLSVFNFKHEVDTGRTSSVAQQIMGFDDKGNNICEKLSVKKPKWEDIVKLSTKIITFYDLAGHEKYLRTTIDGMASNRLDYVLIIVGANMKITEMTLEHINLCMNMNIPFIIVMTKIDLAPPAILKDNFDGVKERITKYARKLSYKIKTEEDVMQCAKKVQTGDIVPIFLTSNVTGEGLNLLKLFLNYLPVRRSFKKVKTRPVKMQVQEIFNVTGSGTILAGLLTSGTVNINDNLLLGPTTTGEFMDIRVRSIEVKRTQVSSAYAGKYVCLGVTIDKNKPKRGMFVVDPKLDPKAIWEFDATIYINSAVDSANIKPGYQPHCHIGHIKQTCKILRFNKINIGKKKQKNIEDLGLTTDPITSIGVGDSAEVTMRFCFHPELVFEDDKTRFVFREGKTKGIGMITAITDTVYESLSNREVTKGQKTRKSRRERRLDRLAHGTKAF